MKNLNREICIKCGTCILDCPTGLIQMTDFPEIPDEAESFCIQCGHCVAICPEGAIGGSIDSRMGEDEQFIITPEKMGSHMKSRRSIRHYVDRLVEKETLEEIFEIVRHAPTAGNGQPVQWAVITDPEKVSQITASTIEWMREVLKGDSPLNDMMSLPTMVEAWDNGVDPILRSAPCLVVAHAPEDNKMAFTDGIIALTHLDLALPSFGMGGCWAGILNIACSQHPSLKSVMGVPEENAVIYPFMVGYPKYQYQRIPERNQPEIIWE